MVNATACGAAWSARSNTVGAFGRPVGKEGVQSGSATRKSVGRCVSIPALVINLVSGVMVLSWGGHVLTQCPPLRLFVVVPSRRPEVLYVIPPCVLGFPETAICALLAPGVLLDELRLSFPVGL